MIKGIDEFHSVNKNFQNHLKSQQTRTIANVKEQQEKHTDILDEVQNISVKIESLKHRLQIIEDKINRLLEVKEQEKTSKF